ncbi:PAS domain-containing protein [Methylomonas sp.]|uniref:PAS domain-containing protein n=1 Tax=Methylomonas sp. TaxID=418 RepID=UPI0034251EC0
MSDPIFIHDGQMHIPQANPAYCKQAGCSLEQMQGRPYYAPPPAGRPVCVFRSNVAT